MLNPQKTTNNFRILGRQSGFSGMLVNGRSQLEKFPENLILIGMFGSGKTTVGRLLAERLRYTFVDVDHLIERKYGRPLQKVLDFLGMKEFMKMENATIQTLKTRRCVISPGGSAVYYQRAMTHLGKMGPRIYLKVPLSTLKKRLPDWSERGVVCRGGKTLPSLYKERVPLLKRHADMTVLAHKMKPVKVIEEIFKKLR